MESTTIIVDCPSWDSLADLSDFITESLTRG
jgi:hypothetical protein